MQLFGYIAIGLLAGSGPIKQDAGLHLRVCDIGPGLACAIRIPDGNGFRYVIYDAGHWHFQQKTKEKIGEIIPAGSKVDWFILSHTDGDHIAGVDELLNEYEAGRIVWPNNERDTEQWRNANVAIYQEKELGARLYRPESSLVRAGRTYQIGDGFIQFIFGRSKPPTSWGFPAGSPEYNNAGSVTIAIEYKGKRILLAGDAVGRKKGGPVGQCIGSERSMTRNNWRVPLKSDVLVAPHHGADNGSSTRFIERVAPSKVIFSCGHQHEHPTLAAALRYQRFGLNWDTDFFRTDIGDQENGTFEWHHVPPGLSITTDEAGKDDIEVKIAVDGTLSVAYRPRTP
jgi:beta-lactamase superfamily II metal-dependent hydrolase